MSQTKNAKTDSRRRFLQRAGGVTAGWVGLNGLGAGLLAGPLGSAATLAQAAELPKGAAEGLILHTDGHPSVDRLLLAELWDLDNRPAHVQPRAGRPLVVNFWARWCGPCRAEIPELVALVQRKEGVDVVGINLEKDPLPVRDFAKAYEVNYPIYQAREGGLELMRALGNVNAGLPYTVVLGKRGQLVASRIGVLKREHLDAALRRAKTA